MPNFDTNEMISKVSIGNKNTIIVTTKNRIFVSLKEKNIRKQSTFSNKEK